MTTIIPRRLRRSIRAFRADQSGGMALVFAVALTAIAGFIALGVEVTGWYKSQRAMQNASDAAAIAAAMNGGSSYADEGKAVAASYGFTDGANGVTVAVQDGQTCPDGSSSCYKAAITQTVSDNTFTRFVYDQAFSLGAQAQAQGQVVPRTYCVLALGGSGMNPALRTNGSPKADLTGCSVMSNTGATCGGHSLQANYGDAHYTNSGCGNVQTSDVPVVTDPYAYLAASIPADSCGGTYYSEPTSKKGTPLPTSNQWSGSKNLSGTTTICGDLQLTGNVTVTTGSGGALLVIRNGNLDLGSYTLQTAAGAGLTIIFTGSNSYSHVVMGTGVIDIAAPTTGTWAGMAIYQDPALTANVDMIFAGNSPTWDVTGAIYLPHANATLKGAVNKSSNGRSCFVLVVDNLLIDGTGSILARGECQQAGVSMPAGVDRMTAKLVN